MSSGDQEALDLADRLTAAEFGPSVGTANTAASTIRRILAERAECERQYQAKTEEFVGLLAEREADRAAMDDALNALVAVRAAVPDLHEYGNLAGNTLGSRVDAAISSLKARTQ